MRSADQGDDVANEGGLNECDVARTREWTSEMAQSDALGTRYCRTRNACEEEKEQERGRFG